MEAEVRGDGFGKTINVTRSKKTVFNTFRRQLKGKIGHIILIYRIYIGRKQQISQ
ncbi:MAG: hypothetical protein LIV11_01185 [Bacillota bacterium]|nr:hypothetical protein [Bacillota bacterium]